MFASYKKGYNKEGDLREGQERSDPRKLGDTYANNIKRLMGLVEYLGRGLDKMAKLAFMTDFPDNVSVIRQQVSSVENMDLCEMIPAGRSAKDFGSSEQW